MDNLFCIMTTHISKEIINISVKYTKFFKKNLNAVKNWLAGFTDLLACDVFVLDVLL